MLVAASVRCWRSSAERASGRRRCLRAYWPPSVVLHVPDIGTVSTGKRKCRFWHVSYRRGEGINGPLFGLIQHSFIDEISRGECLLMKFKRDVIIALCFTLSLRLARYETFLRGPWSLRARRLACFFPDATRSSSRRCCRLRLACTA
ncbi:MAG: hypothetical protein JWO04_2297 [Gammaproteobacteria bacterium]|nr:hypothetical protein [Gammaproteobacteria bacterium]